jgi:hypothetical protein
MTCAAKLAHHRGHWERKLLTVQFRARSAQRTREAEDALLKMCNG